MGDEGRDESVGHFVENIEKKLTDSGDAFLKAHNAGLTHQINLMSQHEQKIAELNTQIGDLRSENRGLSVSKRNLQTELRKCTVRYNHELMRQRVISFFATLLVSVGASLVAAGTGSFAFQLAGGLLLIVGFGVFLITFLTPKQ